MTLALAAIEGELRGIRSAPPTAANGTTFTIYNGETGEGCEGGVGLSFDVAVIEVKRMNREYEEMLSLVRAYVDGGLSSYTLRPSRPLAESEEQPHA